MRTTPAKNEKWERNLTGQTRRQKSVITGKVWIFNLPPLSCVIQLMYGVTEKVVTPTGKDVTWDMGSSSASLAQPEFVLHRMHVG